MNHVRSIGVALRTFHREATKQWVARFEQPAKVST